MSVKLILGTFLTVMVLSLTGGCGKESLTVVEPTEEFQQQVQAAEDAEKNAARK